MAKQEMPKQEVKEEKKEVAKEEKQSKKKLGVAKAQ